MMLCIILPLVSGKPRALARGGCQEDEMAKIIGKPPTHGASV
jgi:hypothetical protein